MCRSLRSLDASARRVFAQAERDGYLTRTPGRPAPVRAWWERCEREGLPYLCLTLRRSVAELECEALPLPAERLPAAVLPWLAALLAEYAPLGQRRVTRGYAGAWGLTEHNGRELAGRVAALLASGNGWGGAVIAMAGSWPPTGVMVDPVTLEPYPPAPRVLVRAANELLAATARVAVCRQLRPGDPPPPGWELVSVDGAPAYRQPIPGGWRYGDVRDCWLEYLRGEPRHAL